MSLINIYRTKEEMAVAAAEKAADILKSRLKEKPIVYFVAATGASQFEFLENLCKIEGVEWNRTEMFHLDEYVGISASHPASFRNYLKTHLIDRILPRKAYLIEGDAIDLSKECERINRLISRVSIDVAFVGIGENGHIAFNDPPADFNTIDPYIIVNLDQKCRQQQVGEGWFEKVEKVPKKAISMSIHEIMRAENIICTCPEKRKAQAVLECLSENADVSPKHPASILKNHNSAYCFLDKDSASLL